MRSLYLFVFISVVAFATASFEMPADWTNIRSDIDRSFSCQGRAYGYYADVANGCEIYHVCEPRIENEETVYKHSPFVCPASTIFDQKSLTCSHPSSEIVCADSERHYAETENRLNNVHADQPVNDVSTNIQPENDVTDVTAEVNNLENTPPVNENVQNHPVAPVREVTSSVSNSVSPVVENVSSEVENSPVVTPVVSPVLNSEVTSNVVSPVGNSEVTSNVVSSPVVNSEVTSNVVSPVGNSEVTSNVVSSPVVSPVVSRTNPVVSRLVSNEQRESAEVENTHPVVHRVVHEHVPLVTRMTQQNQQTLRMEPTKSLNIVKRQLSKSIRSVQQHVAQIPVKSVQMPVKSIHLPVKSVQAPVKSVQEPIKSVQAPVKSVQEPVKSVQMPVKSIHLPVKSVQEPVKSVQTPVKSVQEPVKSVQEPVKSVKAPVKSVQEPVKSVQAPVKSVQEPVKSVQAPVKSVQEPVKSVKRSVQTVRQVPVRQQVQQTVEAPTKSNGPVKQELLKNAHVYEKIPAWRHHHMLLYPHIVNSRSDSHSPLHLERTATRWLNF